MNPTELSTTEPARQNFTTGLSIFDSGSFQTLMSIATAMSRSSLIPKTLCEDKNGRFPDQVIEANCFLVVEQAARWGLSPFAVIGCASVVHGRLMWEGKLVAAVLESKLKVRLSYEYSGSGDNKTVVVSGTMPDEDKPRTVTGTVGAWKTSGNGSPWDKAANHESMLAYRGAREWARRHASSVILGVYTTDEMDESSLIDVTGGRPRVQIRETPHDPATVEASEAEETADSAEVPAGSDDEFPPVDPDPETVPKAGKQTKDRNKRTCRFIDMTRHEGEKVFWSVVFHIGKRNVELTTFSETLAENLARLTRGDIVRIVFTAGIKSGSFQLEDFERVGDAEGTEDGGLI